MKVFISSVITDFEALRDASERAVRDLGYEAIRAEQFAASPRTPQQACLQGVREADVVVAVLGARYGAVQPSGISATHEEIREAVERCPLLIFVQDGVAQEREQQRLIAELQAWDSGHYTATFRDPESLRTAVTRALHRLGLDRARGPVQTDEIAERAMALVPRPRSYVEPRLVIGLAGGPRQSILRPRKIEAPDLAEQLMNLALFGSLKLLDPRAGTDSEIRGRSLVLSQDQGSVCLDEEGSVCVTVPVHDRSERLTAPLLVIMEEDLLELVERSLRFVGTVLDQIDKSHRITHVVPIASLIGGAHLGWQTRAQHARSLRTNSFPLRMGDETTPVVLAPPHRPRAAFALAIREIAEDLVALLRRQRAS